MTYLEGCQATVGEGASAGTRWRGTPVSVATFDKDETIVQRISTRRTYDVDVESCIGYCEVFSVMREAKVIDSMTVVVDVEYSIYWVR